MKSLIKILLTLAVPLVLGTTTLRANEPVKFGLAAENHIFAQRLVNELAASDGTLVGVGIHCIPPGASAQSIVASTLNVIGKPSDPEDIVRGSTTISPSKKAPKLGIMMPLLDASGQEIGSLALQFRYQAGEDQVKFLAAATSIRDRVAQRIPNLAALFAPQS